MVVHHDDLLQQVFGGSADDAVQGPFDDRQGFVQVDEHNSDARQVLRVFLLQTPVQKGKEEREFYLFFVSLSLLENTRRIH